MYKLYFAPGACSLAPHIALVFGQFEHELVKVNLKTKQTATGGDFLAINPKGSVPVLETPEGVVLTEVAVILQYLADQKPELKLLPEFKTTERYAALTWLNYTATEIHKGFSPLFGADKFMKTSEGKAEIKDVYRDLMKLKLDYLDREIGDRKTLLDSGLSIADFYLFNTLNWGQYVGIKLADWSSLNSYFQGILEHEAVKSAMIAEGMRV